MSRSGSIHIRDAATPAPPAAPTDKPFRSLGVVPPGQRREDLRRRPLFDAMGEQLAQPAAAPPRGPGIGCRHFVRTRDATVWAILLRDGRPVLALGPLDPRAAADPPIRRIYAEGIDASAFDLSDFTPAGNRQWRCIGARPPCSPPPPPPPQKHQSIFHVGNV